MIVSPGWKGGSKVPDAIASDVPGIGDVAIEFAGDYSPARIAELEQPAARPISFEIMGMAAVLPAVLSTEKLRGSMRS